MLVTPIKTPIIKPGQDIFKIIKNNIPTLEEKSVLVVTSKIISYCENRFVKKTNFENKLEKHELVKKEADYWIDPSKSKYNLMITIKNRILAVNAGIDESNSINGNYILWPKDPQKSANSIWKFVKKHYSLKKVGVIIADSKTMPLKWGVTGTSIAHCGFKALNDFRGTPDIFGRIMIMEQVNVSEGIAIAAVLETGESNQRTPLAVVNNIKMISFVNHIPTPRELDEERIKLEEDAYYPFLKNTKWHKGGGGK